jgi:alanyl-tRNA synthetase
MIKRFATAAVVAALLAVAGAGSVAASARKPLGYMYGQCASRTTCTYQGSTNPKQNKIALSSTAICASGGSALGRVGYVTIKRGGKFSVNKTVKVTNYQTYETSSVQVQLSGTLKVGKKVVGALKITTTARDCTADTGKSRSFSMKYQGPYYGG